MLMQPKPGTMVFLPEEQYHRPYVQWTAGGVRPKAIEEIFSLRGGTSHRGTAKNIELFSSTNGYFMFLNGPIELKYKIVGPTKHYRVDVLIGDKIVPLIFIEDQCIDGNLWNHLQVVK